MKFNSVQYDSNLKRYRITSTGHEDIRTRNLKRVIADADLSVQTFMADPELNKALFAGLYITGKRPLKLPLIGKGYLSGEHKRLTWWKLWLYYIVSYAKARKLLPVEGDLSDVSPEDLIAIWSKLYPHPQETVIVEYADSEALLNWLKTPPARETLRQVLRDFQRDVLGEGIQ